MKLAKIFFIGSAFFCSFVFLGCGKKSSEQALEAAPEHDFTSEVVIPAAAAQAKAKQNTAQTVPAVMLWKPNGALWLETDGVMQWGHVDLTAGSQFEAVCDKDGNPEIKTAKRKSGSSIEEREFVRVKYGERDDYWAQTGMVAVNAKVAVISAENTLIYNTPSMTGMGSTVIPVGTVVAVLQDNDADSTFVKIDASLSDYIDVRSKYIKSDKIVTNADDVQVLQLLSLAKSSKNETVRNELLDNAKSLKPSETVAKMLSDFEAELAAAASKTYTEKTLEGESVILVKSDNGDTINVRSEPGTNGAVVLKMQDSAPLLAVGITEEQDTIDGKEAAWIHVKEITPNEDKGGFSQTGKEGWIFAAYTSYGSETASESEL